MSALLQICIYAIVCKKNACPWLYCNVHFCLKVVHKNKQFKLLYILLLSFHRTCVQISGFPSQTKLTKNAQVSKYAKCIKEKPQIKF